MKLSMATSPPLLTSVSLVALALCCTSKPLQSLTQRLKIAISLGMLDVLLIACTTSLLDRLLSPLMFGGWRKTRQTLELVPIGYLITLNSLNLFMRILIILRIHQAREEAL